MLTNPRSSTGSRACPAEGCREFSGLATSSIRRGNLIQSGCFLRHKTLKPYMYRYSSHPILPIRSFVTGPAFCDGREDCSPKGQASSDSRPHLTSRLVGNPFQRNPVYLQIAPRRPLAAASAPSLSSGPSVERFKFNLILIQPIAHT